MVVEVVVLKNMKWISTEGVNWNCADVGVCRDDGVPLLLVHGFPLDHSMWKFQIEDFSKHTRVICPDLPGFGGSQLKEPQPEMGMDWFASQLATLLKALEVSGPIDFCGLSMGGYIGWQFWQHHRRLMRKLVACDTRSIADSPEVARGRRMMARTIGTDGNQSMIDNGFLNKLFAKDTILSANPVVDEAAHVIVSAKTASVGAAQLGMAARPDVTAWLENIEMPTMLVCGTHDGISTVEEMRSMSRLIPNSQFVEIDDAGHMAPLEQPEQFNKSVGEFLFG